MKHNKNKIQLASNKLRSLISLNQEEYNTLFKVFDELVKEKLSLTTLKGQLRLFKDFREQKAAVFTEVRLSLISFYFI